MARLFVGSLARELNTSDEEVSDFKLIIDEACTLCIREAYSGSISIEVQIEKGSIKQTIGPFGPDFKEDIRKEEDVWAMSILQSLTNKVNFVTKDDHTFMELIKQLPPLPYPRV